MDISETTAPKSDQQNFDDYITGPKTVTIADVREGTKEQPVEIHLAEFPGRPYKPSKTMRRVLISAWGSKGEVYVGRQMQLYGDPDVKYAGEKVGGIKIGALSHIDKPLSLSLTATRGKKAPHSVDVLTTPSTPTPETVATCTDTAELGAMWKASGPEMRARIEARVAELKQPAGPLIPEGAAQ